MLEVWRSVWRSSDAAARLAFATAVATTAYYLGFGVFSGLVTAYSDASHVHDRFIAITDSIFSGIGLAGSLAIIQVAIALALRSTSAGYRMVGSVAALIPFAIASGFVLQLTGVIAAGEPSYGVAATLDEMLVVPFVVMAAINVVVAVLGLAGVARSARLRARVMSPG